MTSHPVSTWQTALDPTLLRRLNRPLKQPGVTNHRMANVLIGRSHQLHHRLPLLDQQMNRWSTLVDLDAEQAPIVYIQPSDAPLDAQNSTEGSSRAKVPTEPQHALITGQEDLLLVQGSPTHQVIDQPTPPVVNRIDPDQSSSFDRTTHRSLEPAPNVGLAEPTGLSTVTPLPVAEAKLIDAKLVNAKPADAKPINAKPIEAQWVDAKPAEVQGASVSTQTANSSAAIPPIIADSTGASPVLPLINSAPTPIAGSVIQMKADTSSSHTSSNTSSATVEIPPPSLQTPPPDGQANRVTRSPLPVLTIHSNLYSNLPSLSLASASDQSPDHSAPSTENATITASPTTSTDATAAMALQGDQGNPEPRVALLPAVSPMSLTATEASVAMPLRDAMGNHQSPSQSPNQSPNQSLNQPSTVPVSAHLPTVAVQTAAATPIPVVQRARAQAPPLIPATPNGLTPNLVTPSSGLAATLSIGAVAQSVIQLKPDTATLHPLVVPAPSSTIGIEPADGLNPLPLLKMPSDPIVAATSLSPTPIITALESGNLPDLTPMPPVVQTKGESATPERSPTPFSTPVKLDSSISLTDVPAISPVTEPVVQLKQDTASLPLDVVLTQPLPSLGLETADSVTSLPLLELSTGDSMATAPSVIPAPSNSSRREQPSSQLNPISSAPSATATDASAPAVMPSRSDLTGFQSDMIVTPAFDRTASESQSVMPLLDSPPVLPSSPHLDLAVASAVTVAPEIAVSPSVTAMPVVSANVVQAKFDSASVLPPLRVSGLPDSGLPDSVPVVPGRIAPPVSLGSSIAATSPSPPPLVIYSQNRFTAPSAQGTAIATSSPTAIPLSFPLSVVESTYPEEVTLPAATPITEDHRNPSTSPSLSPQFNPLPTVQILSESPSEQFEPLILSRPDRYQRNTPTTEAQTSSHSSKTASIVHQGTPLSSPQPSTSSHPSSHQPVVSPATVVTSHPRTSINAGIQQASTTINAPPPINVEAIVDKVERRIMKRLVVESERRGKTKWP